MHTRQKNNGEAILQELAATPQMPSEAMAQHLEENLGNDFQDLETDLIYLCFFALQNGVDAAYVSAMYPLWESLNVANQTQRDLATG